MGSDSAEMVSEIQSKVILHWNCRGLAEFPHEIRIYGGHIREIYLKWNNLTTLPPWIIELFNVTNLYMYGNLIRDLPRELGGMHQLTVLDLSANKLERVPPCIGNLRNLKFLLLNDNNIERLPPELEQLRSLETLSVCGNSIVALPEWLGSLPNLKELNADSNLLRELPNRLTLSPALSVLSVCSNRLRYLPLNGFVSSPSIKFDANASLNYLSYPLLYQLISRLPDLRERRNTLGYGCFETSQDEDEPSTNIKLRLKINRRSDNVDYSTIKLPRQLLKVHSVYRNDTVSLWELALRKVYTTRFLHTLSISTSPPAVRVQCSPKNSGLWSLLSPSDRVSYSLLTNGPIGVCVNLGCQHPIFTEAWLLAGLSLFAESILTIALCCCKRCAAEFSLRSNTIAIINWSQAS